MYNRYRGKIPQHLPFAKKKKKKTRASIMDMLGGFFLWQNISKLVSFPFSEEKGPGDGGRTGITP